MQAQAQWHGRAWEWFKAHASSRHALVWLMAVAFADAIFFPVAPEVFMVALTLAHPHSARRYLGVALPASVLGAAVGYFVAHFLFNQFGAPILEFYGQRHSFIEAQHLIRGHVFWTMALGNFSPVPDKLFIYAGGLLGVPFLPFIAGYTAGRAARMSVALYLAERYGARALIIFRRYLAASAAALLILATIYAMVHWHLLPL